MVNLCRVCVFIRKEFNEEVDHFVNYRVFFAGLSSQLCVYSYEVTSDEHYFYAAIIAIDCGNSY